jgi:hypothetical protein
MLGFVERVTLFQILKYGYWWTELYFALSHKCVRLRLNASLPQNEKNWAFLGQNGTHINLVASLSPLRIVDCDVISGVCSASQGPIYSTIGELRPGTQFVAFPSPALFGVRDVYVGWARAHLRRCRAPVWRFYRPNLVILMRNHTGGVLIVGVSDFFNFGCWIPYWFDPYLSSGCTDAVSVLLPCSIGLWNLSSGHMLVTLSASDISVSVVAVEGVGYIIRELFKGQVDVSKDFSVAIVSAAMHSSRIVCMRFIDERMAQCLRRIN